MSKKFRFPIVVVLLLLTVTGCFRDAGNGNAKPTKVSINQLRPSATLTPTKLPPTFTPQAEIQPSKTLGAGGPPILTSPSPNATVAPEDATLAPPGLGDSGQSATPVPESTETLSPLEATPTSFAEPDKCIYQVQGGDTLYSIATSFSLFPEDFYAVNPELAANPNALSIGQEIKVPNCISDSTATVSAPEATAPVGTPLPQGMQSYTVKEGDSLYGIALQFGVTVQQIIDATDFLVSENTIIRPGDVVMIPAPQ